MSVPLDPPPSRLLVSELCDLLTTYLQAQEVKEVYRAYLFSAIAHEGQTRKSGGPYIFHPLTAAYILGQMHLDTQTLCAALLHDVIEDTDITKEKLASEFGEQVAELVDGVSKLSSVQFKSREQAQAASFRKMILAMSRDLRVIIIKLADRLHNMRTIGAMKPASRRRIARETLEIYAPIANRLGMNAVRRELQELCFATLYPLRHRVLTQQIQKLYHERTEIFCTIKTIFEEHLAQCNVNATVSRQIKYSYTIYENMREEKAATFNDKRKTFSQITNVCAFRIDTNSIDDCYRVLGIAHNIYKPRYECFKDYIAIPKINGYQSLHTVLVSPHGFLIDIQIGTIAMYELAENGITAHGLYKFNKESDCPHEATNYLARPCTREWLHNLLDIQKSTIDSLEFLENVKTDLFPNEVYVFTPKGKIVQLPKNATAIDFAYEIHSEIGNRCIKAKVDNQYVPLSTPLVSGQTVEMFTATWARPKPNWLSFAVSARARSHIRNFLKNLQHEEAVILGKRMLDKELLTYSLSVDKLNEEQCSCLLTTFKVDKLDTLLAKIGLGNTIALIVACQFDPRPDSSPQFNDNERKPLIITGTEGMSVMFSRCCSPIPGDDIIGFVSAGRGIVIHAATCKNVTGYRSHPEKLLPVEWESGISGEFVVDICVDVYDRRGVLASVAKALANMDSNIEYVSNENSDGNYSTIKFGIYVRSRVHLAAIMRHVRRLENVNRIRRSKN